MVHQTLYLSESEAKWTPDAERVPSSAGRFDIGPEYLIPKRPELWSESWESTISGARRAKLTSRPSLAAGVQLLREFELAADSSHLRCTQTIVNTSDQAQAWCHWSRTFAIHGGIGIVPLSPEWKRFPNGYIMMRGRDEMLILPEDDNIRIREGMVEILAPPAEPKLGFDSFAGWFAYQMPNDLLFVKSYTTYPNRLYNEIAGLTISIWYPQSDRIAACELEPIGPMQSLKPGEQSSFTENWRLVPHEFPQKGASLDLQAVQKKVAKALGDENFGPASENP